MKTEVVPVTPDILAAFVPRMIDRDREELGNYDLAALAANSEHTFAGVVDDDPVFIGGVVEPGQVWMLVAHDVKRARKFFLRTTKAQTDIMARMFARMTTYEEATDAASLRWLDWLGFQPVEVEMFNGRPVFRLEA